MWGVCVHTYLYLKEIKHYRYVLRILLPPAIPFTSLPRVPHSLELDVYYCFFKNAITTYVSVHNNGIVLLVFKLFIAGIILVILQLL